MKKTSNVSPARSVAFDLVRGVLARRHALDEALAAHDGFRRLPGRDRGFARLISATVLRRCGQIDALIDACLEKPLPRQADAVRDIMRLAVAELVFLGVQAHAAVDSAVTQVESRGHGKFKGLVNAVLRRISREGTDRLSSLPDRLNFPEWMIAGWVDGFGEAVADQIASASLKEPPLDISVTADTAEWAKKLDAVILPTGSLRRGFDGLITELPGFEEGAWWVQDAAAAIPARLLGDVSGLDVFDICAAPGGKTAQLAALGARVTAVDRSEKRLRRLMRNIERLGLSASTVTADATEWQPPVLADAILLDPPCTSTGTIRRHPDILHLKSRNDIAKLSDLQSKLLSGAAKMVKPGGTLIYCTCSMQREECEDVVARFLDTASSFQRKAITPEDVGGLGDLVTSNGDLRTLPFHLADKGGLDGFYAARLVRS